MAAHNETGKKGEDIAAGFMEAKGYIILDRNYRFERAEIDLVALRFEPAVLVFIEVKTCTNTRDSIRRVHWPQKKSAYSKWQTVISMKTNDSCSHSFDIISIGMDNPEHPMIYHIEDAFRLDGPFL
ncbi:MAG: YraN family protein [Bacteroidia bacterium]